MDESKQTQPPLQKSINPAFLLKQPLPSSPFVPLLPFSIPALPPPHLCECVWLKIPFGSKIYHLLLFQSSGTGHTPIFTKCFLFYYSPTFILPTSHPNTFTHPYSSTQRDGEKQRKKMGQGLILNPKESLNKTHTRTHAQSIIKNRNDTPENMTHPTHTHTGISVFQIHIRKKKFHAYTKNINGQRQA